MVRVTGIVELEESPALACHQIGGLAEPAPAFPQMEQALDASQDRYRKADECCVEGPDVESGKDWGGGGANDDKHAQRVVAPSMFPPQLVIVLSFSEPAHAEYLALSVG